MSPEDEYEAGDVNAVEGYEPGDVNTRGPADVDDEYDDEVEDLDDDDQGDDEGDEADEPGDDDDDETDDANQVDGGMPEAVLRYVARSLADEPDAVDIETEDRRGSVMLRLRVAPDDMGRVIGRRGRTAQAIRTLVGVAGARQGIQTRVDIVDD